MEFRKYEKIHRLGKDEVEGILDVPVLVQEKVDGANLSVFTGNDGRIHVCSRNNDVTDRADGFNGAVKYCQEHEGIRYFLEKNPKCILYGEWLVRHTIAYKETAYRQFYLFDVYDTELEKYMSARTTEQIAKECKINYPPILAELEKPTIEEINKHIGKSAFGDRGEGVVIKPRVPYKNQFGDTVYAKVVTQEFKEDNGIVFGGNNRHSDTYWEMYFINKYVTLPRVQKVMNKIQPELDEKLDMKHIPRIMGTVYHDMIAEEGWEMFRDAPALNFNKFKELANKKAKQIYVDILHNNISVADQ